MFELATQLNNFFKSQIKLNPDTIPENSGSSNKSCLVEKQFGREVDDTKASNPVRDEDFAKTLINDLCHLTSKLGGLAQDACNSNTRKAPSSFISRLFRNFSGYDCHLFFGKLNKMAIEKGIEMKKMRR